MSKTQNKKVNGSSSAFAWGRTVFTEYKGGCVRYILLQSHHVRETGIPKKYKIMGAANEERYEKILLDSGIKFKREYSVKAVVSGVPTVTFSGRVDFIRDTEAGVLIEELKSTDNKNKLRDIIKNGVWVTENLAQLVSYMVALESWQGRLIYTYYEDGEAKNERAFEVTIDDAGRICVDATPTKFTVYDQIAHLRLAAKAIEANEIGDRPYNWNTPFKSPCTFCPFASTCIKYDCGEIKDVEAFVMSAKDDLIKLGEKKDESRETSAIDAKV